MGASYILARQELDPVSFQNSEHLVSFSDEKQILKLNIACIVLFKIS